MVVKAEQERVKALIADTVSLLCKNGLNYTKEFCIEGLLGITLDQDEVFLVNIKEIVKTELGAKEDESDSGSGSAGEDGEKTKPQKRKKRKRRRSSRASNNESDNEETNSSMAQANNSDNGEPANKSIKQELEDDSGDDLVFVKDEPSANNSFGQTSFSQSQFPGADNSNILGNLSQHGQLYATPQSDPLPGPSWDPNVSQAAMFNTSQQQHLTSQQQPGANASSQMFIASPAVASGSHLRCLPCGWTFESVDELSQHTTAEHTFYCRECNKTLKTATGYDMHMNSHKGVDAYRYKCEHCSKGFNSSTTLKEHLSAHTNTNYFICKECGADFRYHYKLRVHKKTCGVVMS